MKKPIYIIIGIVILVALGAGSWQFYQVRFTEKQSTKTIAELQKQEIEDLKKNIAERNIKLQATEKTLEKILSNSEISAEEITPYMEGIAQIRCYDSEGYLISSGSASLWDFIGNLQYAVLTNAHVVSSGECVLLYYRYDKGRGSEIGDESFADEFFNLKIARISDLFSEEDAAVLQIVPDSEHGQAIMPELNYKISHLESCPLRMPQGLPVAVIGFPAFASRQGTDFGLGDAQISSRTLTSGIISGYDTRSIGQALPSVNYFVSATIDAGNSGGVAISKYNGQLCLLGQPTWVSLGYYANQGMVQNIHNVSRVWQ